MDLSDPIGFLSGVVGAAVKLWDSISTAAENDKDCQELEPLARRVRKLLGRLPPEAARHPILRDALEVVKEALGEAQTLVEDVEGMRSGLMGGVRRLWRASDIQNQHARVMRSMQTSIDLLATALGSTRHYDLQEEAVQLRRDVSKVEGSGIAELGRESTELKALLAQQAQSSRPQVTDMVATKLVHVLGARPTVDEAAELRATYTRMLQEQEASVAQQEAGQGRGGAHVAAAKEALELEYLGQIIRAVEVLSLNDEGANSDIHGTPDSEGATSYGTSTGPIFSGFQLPSQPPPPPQQQRPTLMRSATMAPNRRPVSRSVSSVNLGMRGAFSISALPSDPQGNTSQRSERPMTPPPPPPPPLPPPPVKPSSPPSHLCCPISQELLQDPVLLGDTGHTYERANIERWLQDHSTDPLTMRRLVGMQERRLVTNRVAADAAAQWRHENPTYVLAQASVSSGMDTPQSAQYKASSLRQSIDTGFFSTTRQQAAAAGSIWDRHQPPQNSTSSYNNTVALRSSHAASSTNSAWWQPISAGEGTGRGASLTATSSYAPNSSASANNAVLAAEAACAAILVRDHTKLVAIISAVPDAAHTPSPNHEYFTPLHIAARLGRPRKLVPMCSLPHLKVDVVSGPVGSTPLAAGASAGQLVSVEILMKAGADPCVPRALDGRNSLHLAAARGHTACLEYMLEHMQEGFLRKGLNAQDVLGNTPLHLAAAHTTPVTTTSVTATSPSEPTPFYGDAADIVASLLRAGANPCIMNAAGLTPAAIASTDKVAHLIEAAVTSTPMLHTPPRPGSQQPPSTSSGSLGRPKSSAGWRSGRWGCQRVLQGHSGAVTCVAWAPGTADIENVGTSKAINGSSDSGRSLIATGSWDETVRICDTTSGATVHTLNSGFNSVVEGVAWAPDASLLAIAGGEGTGHTTSLFKCNSWQVRAHLQGHKQFVRSVACSPRTGRALVWATGASDATVRLWDVASGVSMGVLTGHSSGISCVSFSPEGLLASSSMDSSVRLWDVRSPAVCASLLRGFGGWVLSTAWSPSGYNLVAACGQPSSFSSAPSGCLRVWDVRSARCMHKMDIAGDTAFSVSWPTPGSSSTGLVAVGSMDGIVRLVDSMGWSVVGELRGHKQQISEVAWSPCGNVLASASHDKTVRLWVPVPDSLI